MSRHFTDTESFHDNQIPYNWKKEHKKHVNMQTGRDQAESETAVVDILETNIQMTHYVQHIWSTHRRYKHKMQCLSTLVGV